ncbi:hypothetical protein TWF102_002730 [Orbilia oligospora]|uniref:BTB domain-containing protein n=1 Tax=Orbilia oligospora TaxID=2813651 RepID=A0A7C8NJ61_ORBOL|nr:hypothetical protein TWF102_002730 [Orbilia oligospora]KAF3116110.1 hypothetical protein TWF103_009340 [Orbilia oligospora]KAF3136931.1 hypothetical protein TWF703_005251 [Orbilia oligospora]
MTFSDSEEPIVPQGDTPIERIKELPDNYEENAAEQQRGWGDQNGDDQAPGWGETAAGSGEVDDGQQQDNWGDVSQKNNWEDRSHIEETKSIDAVVNGGESWCGSPMKVDKKENTGGKGAKKNESSLGKSKMSEDIFSAGVESQNNNHRQQPQEDQPLENISLTPKPPNDPPLTPKPAEDPESELYDWRKIPALPVPRRDGSYSLQAYKASSQEHLHSNEYSQQLPQKPSYGKLPPQQPNLSSTSSHHSHSCPRPASKPSSPIFLNGKLKSQKDNSQKEQRARDISPKPRSRADSIHKPPQREETLPKLPSLKDASQKLPSSKASSQELNPQDNPSSNPKSAKASPQTRGDSSHQPKFEFIKPYSQTMSPPNTLKMVKDYSEPEHSRKNEKKPSKEYKGETSNPPRPRPIPQQPVVSGDSLLNLLISGEFSDMTVVIGSGREKRIYRLHKNILCTKSEYFQGAVQNLNDPSRGELWIRIRDLLPPIFDLVLEWIYGDVLAIERHQPLILALYRAATFLKIRGLKLHIARSVSKMLKGKRKYGTGIDFDDFEVVRGLFRYAESSEYFSSLRKCTDELALQNNVPKDMLAAEHAKKRDEEATDANTKFWMALSLSYQLALDATVCSGCRGRVSTKTRNGLDRKCCHCDSEDEGSGPSSPPPPQPRPAPESRRGPDPKSEKSDKTPRSARKGKDVEKRGS